MLYSEKTQCPATSPIGIVKSSGSVDTVRHDLLKVDKRPGGYEYILVICPFYKIYTNICD